MVSNQGRSEPQRQTWRLHVDPVRFGVLGEDLMPVDIASSDLEAADISCGPLRLSVRVAGGHSSVVSWIEDLNVWILDLIVSKVFVQDEASVLLLHPSSGGGVWLCSVTESAHGWQCMAVERDRILISPEYAMAQLSDREQSQHIRDAHAEFMNFVGAAPISGFSGQNQPRLLRIKVDPRERWFVSFPLGLFAKLCLSGFENCSACQWIVTDRTITQVAASQRAVEKQFADTSEFPVNMRDGCGPSLVS
jgi:hypothetical protein